MSIQKPGKTQGQVADRRVAERKGERRVHPRMPSPPMEVGGLWARIYDISLGGICLILNEPLKPGDEYGLVLTDGLFQAHSIQSEVVWSSGRSAGLRWVQLTVDQEMWLRDQFASGEARLRVALLKGKEVN